MLSLTRYNPFDASFTDLENIFDVIDRDFFRSKITEFSHDIQVTKDKEAAYIQVAVPGFAKEDLKVTVKNDVLTVSGKLQGDDSTKNRGYFAKEFKRQWTLGESHNAEQISSKLADGILVVKVPFKVVEEKPETEMVVKID